MQSLAGWTGSGTTGTRNSSPGTSLGRYDLLMLVAETDMSQLWAARQQGKYEFDRIVAVKTIVPHLARKSGFQRMLLDEATNVARIRHVNVGRVLDVGEEDGIPFVVMEWIDGEPLANVLRAMARAGGGCLPPAVVARIAADACAGLHAAHELVGPDGEPLEVIHRDISPENLFVGFDGITRVVDFGMAKTRNRMSLHTSGGALSGRTPYMAPEQGLARRVDRRTDVWGVGATMFRCLAGFPPYGASDVASTVRAIMAGSPPERLGSSTPKPLREVVHRALQVDPAGRFESAAEMARALVDSMVYAGRVATHDDVAGLMAAHLESAHELRMRTIAAGVRRSRSTSASPPAHARAVTGISSISPALTRSTLRGWALVIWASLLALLGGVMAWRRGSTARRRSTTPRPGPAPRRSASDSSPRYR